MKRANLRFAFVMLLTICLISMLYGCGRSYANMEESEQEDVSTVIREKMEKWPDNDYTRVIIKPEIGTLDYALYDKEEGYYAVFLKDVTLEAGKQYIQLLQKNGFETVSSDSNSVAIGELLQKDNARINVSVSENVLAIYITLNSDDNNL